MHKTIVILQMFNLILNLFQTYTTLTTTALHPCDEDSDANEAERMEIMKIYGTAKHPDLSKSSMKSFMLSLPERKRQVLPRAKPQR
jgi:hypothetical protein